MYTPVVYHTLRRTGRPRTGGGGGSYWGLVMPRLGTPKVNPPSGQLPAGGWPGARAGWLAARVHPVSLIFMHDACMI